VDSCSSRRREASLGSASDTGGRFGSPQLYAECRLNHLWTRQPLRTHRLRILFRSDRADDTNRSDSRWFMNASQAASAGFTSVDLPVRTIYASRSM